jgi:ParB-like chromosome segregation protein Spo0J
MSERAYTEEELNFISQHPVNKVIWVPTDQVRANDYNPNSVAPPEMKLLELSIQADGYTQPIVVWQIKDDEYEVVDGFHRHLVGKKNNYPLLPVVVINKDRTSRQNRISSTVRHNRARGKHSINGMCDLVRDLSRLKWSDERISKELGMDMDEVVRLKQISGLTELFEDKDFSKAWEFNEEIFNEALKEDEQIQ